MRAELGSSGATHMTYASYGELLVETASVAVQRPPIGLS